MAALHFLDEDLVGWYSGLPGRRSAWIQTKSIVLGPIERSDTLEEE